MVHIKVLITVYGCSCPFIYAKDVRWWLVGEKVLSFLGVVIEVQKIVKLANLTDSTLKFKI